MKNAFFFVLSVLLSVCSIANASGGQKAAAEPKHRVVFQLSEPEGPAWEALVLHVNNTMNALADDGGAQVEIVFYGPGLMMLTKASKSQEEPLKKLTEHGVTLMACRNAMKARKVKPDDLFPFAGQVDSGIAEMVKKQEAGWAYVH